MSDAWIVPAWPAPANVKALSTTRAGGVGTAPFDSLNLGTHVGDDPAVDEAAVRPGRSARIASGRGSRTRPPITSSTTLSPSRNNHFEWIVAVAHATAASGICASIR